MPINAETSVNEIFKRMQEQEHRLASYDDVNNWNVEEEIQKASQGGASSSTAREIPQEIQLLQDILSETKSIANNQKASMRTEETLTQKAFDTVKSVRDNLEDLYTYVEKFRNEKNPTTANLFEMQYKVIQMSVLMDISSKVGDKASQAFQTLFRNQG